MSESHRNSICAYCHTSDCGSYYDDPKMGSYTRTELCRQREWDAHHFLPGEAVLMRRYEDELCADSENSGESPPPALVAMERERKAGAVVSVAQMYPGSDQVTVEVDGYQTVLWNKYLQHADPEAAAERRKAWMIGDESVDARKGREEAEFPGLDLEASHELMQRLQDEGVTEMAGLSFPALNFVDADEHLALDHLAGIQGSFEGLACRVGHGGTPLEVAELRELAQELADTQMTLLGLQARIGAFITKEDAQCFTALTRVQAAVDEMWRQLRDEPVEDARRQVRALQELADQVGSARKRIDEAVYRYLDSSSV